MKKRILLAGTILTAAIALAGCQQGNAARTQQESTGQTMEAQAPKTQNNTETDTAAQKAEAAGDQTGEVKDTSGQITEEEAKSIAFKDAGVEESQITGVRVHQEYDDGRQKYEVDFYVDNKEYDYDIDVVTGEILSVDFEIEDDFFDWEDKNSQQQVSGTISREEAVKIVLERVPGAAEQDVHMELEKDDGRWKYEGEIHYNQREYEFELNGETGEVLEWSDEGIDD